MKLHLGCGKNVLRGWENLDEAPGPLGVTCKLPQALGAYPDRSCDFIFTEHFIEHLDRFQGIELIEQCFRVLKHGGVLRISTPDMAVLVNDYREQKIDRWLQSGWAPKTPAQLLNEGMRSWGHLYLYDDKELVNLLMRAGFTTIVGRLKPGVSHWPELAGLECRPFFNDLICEARKG